jgi:hypothetical protein
LKTDHFPPEVCQHLGYYVYRLIDPRTGDTFYVGKGKDDRVFAHAKGEIECDASSEKLKRILQIQRSGFEVQHVIHRHGLTEREAYEVEAALLDAYAGLTNEMGGRGSFDRGARHAKNIVELYQSAEVVFEHSAIAICINQSAEERSIYEAARGVWKLNLKRARKTDIVLAERSGLVVDVFKAETWYPAHPDHFPWLEFERPNRFGFEGKRADETLQKLYSRKRLPRRKKGATNPIRYF